MTATRWSPTADGIMALTLTALCRHAGWMGSTRFTELTGCSVEGIQALQSESFNAPYNTTRLLEVG